MYCVFVFDMLSYGFIVMLARKFNLREIWTFLVIRYTGKNYRLIIDPKPMLKVS
jgi:hypothetical protein